MEPSGDELAGVVDLFGGLTPAELGEAMAEIAFKEGEDHDPAAFAEDIATARESYHLVTVSFSELESRPSADQTPDAGGEEENEKGIEKEVGKEVEKEADADASETTLLVPGPLAFPELPAGGTDVPHILDVEERSVPRKAAGLAARKRLEEDAASAIEAGDDERIETLVDVSYELEVWAPVSVDDVRDHLAAVRD